MRPIRTVAALVAVGALAAGCSSGDDPEARPEPRQLRAISKLERFDSCDALHAWAHDELAPRVGAYGFAGGGVVAEDSIGAAGAAEGTVPPTAPVPDAA
ncbi:MAG TPA: hypothetical protein VF743_07185, partial [Acidimicrobiales bacterium]